MNCKIVLIVAIAALVTIQAAPPVFLENGSRICTLNNVGVIPKGSLNYPVYQKVCRGIIPTLGDAVDDEEGQVKSRKSNSEAAQDDETEKVRRAILMADTAASS